VKPVSCTGISFAASEVDEFGRIGEAGDPKEVRGEAPELGDEKSESKIEARVESPEFKTDAPARIDAKPEILDIVYEYFDMFM
jgi:hypothetical protein